ncbi:shematrin-like protein 2 [Armigeres subalbatus]|uniref:shematrin-like protein 2 n=1 Tax=Armigeres subalbatus TaxID=124917 RepID=UPI002ED149E4
MLICADQQQLHEPIPEWQPPASTREQQWADIHRESFIALLALAVVAAEAGFAPAAVPVSTSVWPPYGVYGKGSPAAWPYAYNGWNNGWAKGWNNDWNNGWSSWNDGAQVVYGYPKTAAWSNLGRNTVVEANIGKAVPYGLPWGTYGTGVDGWAGGYGGYLTTKQVAVAPQSVHVAAVPVAVKNW